MVSVTDEEMRFVEETMSRLMDEMVKLKRLGAVPKSKKVTEALVKSCIFKLGMTMMAQTCYDDFDKFCIANRIYRK